jgi:hypothetical protein
MAGGSSPRPSKRLVWISGLMLIAAGCADPPAMPEAPTVAPPVPAGQARIWFSRDWEPSESLNLANMHVNGSYFAPMAASSTAMFHPGITTLRRSRSGHRSCPQSPRGRAPARPADSRRRAELASLREGRRAVCG